MSSDWKQSHRLEVVLRRFWTSDRGAKNFASAKSTRLIERALKGLSGYAPIMPSVRLDVACGDFNKCPSYMLSGVYRISFQGPGEAAKGIICAKNGRIVGGDSCYVFGGTVDAADDQISATIRVINDSPAESGIFRDLVNFEMTISGRTSGGGFKFEGFPDGQPAKRFVVQGTKLGDV